MLPGRFKSLLGWGAAKGVLVAGPLTLLFCGNWADALGKEGGSQSGTGVAAAGKPREQSSFAGREMEDQPVTHDSLLSRRIGPLLSASSLQGKMGTWSRYCSGRPVPIATKAVQERDRSCVASL